MRTPEVGAGSGWVRTCATYDASTDYVSLDIKSGAEDIIGDIPNLEALPLETKDFDVMLDMEILGRMGSIPSCEGLIKPGSI